MFQKDHRTIAIILLSVCIAFTSSCGDEDISTGTWSQFHADDKNQGFITVNSSPATDALWKRDIGPVAHSSPVIATDGAIHIGTTDGNSLL